MNGKVRLSALLVTVPLALALGACAPPLVRPLPGSAQVIVAKGPPPAGYVAVGPISAHSGHICSRDRGTYINALNRLRNKALLAGASYVEIFAIDQPGGMTGLCANNGYSIDGMAFRAAGVAAHVRPAVPR